MKRFACTFLGFVFMVSLLGCRTASPFAKDGIPKQSYRVGGGRELKYRAPATGMLWLVEENSRRIVLSEFLERGKSFKQQLDPAEKDFREICEQLGINLPDARFGLYFVPSRWADGKAK